MSTLSNEVTTGGRTREVPVWDPLVRIFHWSLVAAFATAYLSGEAEASWHDWAGYVVAGLVAFRLVWGFVGPRHARFRDFVRPPREVFAYARGLLAGQPRRYLGHNPLGGLMVVALLASLALTAATGYALERGEEAEHQAAAPGMGAVSALAATVTPIAPAYAHEERELDRTHEWLEEAHEWFAHLSLVLVFVHIAGVAVMSLVHRENLVRAMFTGRKRA